DGLLDDADQRVVPPGVLADRAHLLLGQVPALAAEADAFLDLLDRRGERERLVLADLQQVEREPLRRPLPDPGQARQLRDEVLDGGREHPRIVPFAPALTLHLRLARPNRPTRTCANLTTLIQVPVPGQAPLGELRLGRRPPHERAILLCAVAQDANGLPSSHRRAQRLSAVGVSRVAQRWTCTKRLPRSRYSFCSTA